MSATYVADQRILTLFPALVVRVTHEKIIPAEWFDSSGFINSVQGFSFSCVGKRGTQKWKNEYVTFGNGYMLSISVFLRPNACCRRASGCL